jgi:toxin ParE1/3/4
VTVRFTPKARIDLLDIADTIARDNPARARSFVRELVNKALALRELPHGFPIVPDLADLHVRRRSHGNYLILYRVETSGVLVLRIVHGARDYISLLTPE